MILSSSVNKNENNYLEPLNSMHVRNNAITEKGIDALGAKQALSYLRGKLKTGDEYYEYKTLVFNDKEFLVNNDTESIDLTLNKLALEGWRVKAAARTKLWENDSIS